MSKLLHIKGSRVKILGSLPTNSFGNDGDIVLSSIKGKGAYLCAKMNGRWHVANKLEDLKKMERTSIRDLKVDKLRVGNATLTKDEYDKPVGDFTLDVAGDIELNADGGQVTIKDDSASHFLFDCDATSFTIYDATDAADLFRIRTSDSGATTITTVDDGAAIGHLTLAPDGNLILDPGSQKTIISATDGLYFDGGTHTYIVESSADNLRFVVGGVTMLDLTEGAIADTVNVLNSHLSVPATKHLYLDGGGNTYIKETSADKLEIFVGGDEMVTLDEANQRIILEASKLSYHIEGGTEYSATDSAYAGMILGYTDIGLDEATATYDTTTSYAVPTSEFKVVFVSPPSGNVEISIQVMYDVGSSNVADLYAGLSDNATYNAIDDFHEVEIYDAMSRGAIRTIKHSWTLTGLTAGTSYTRWVGFKTSNTSGTPHLQWGGDATNLFPDFIMKATALPATIAT